MQLRGQGAGYVSAGIKKVNPPQGQAALNTMDILLDPKDGQQEEATHEQAADTQAADEKATEAKEEGQGDLVD